MRAKSTSATRVCPGCSTEKPRSAFGHHRVCPPCRKDQQLQKDYGITLETWLATLYEQGGGCAICDTQADEVKLVSDGDKDLKAFYGILCLRCLACARAEREYRIHPPALRDSTLLYLENSTK